MTSSVVSENERGSVWGARDHIEILVGIGKGKTSPGLQMVGSVPVAVETDRRRRVAMGFRVLDKPSTADMGQHKRDVGIGQKQEESEEESRDADSAKEGRRSHEG